MGIIFTMRCLGWPCWTWTVEQGGIGMGGSGSKPALKDESLWSCDSKPETIYWTKGFKKTFGYTQWTL